VLLDLYLAQPKEALAELVRYRELTGADKPVSGWIAELRARTGIREPVAPVAAAPPAATAELPEAEPTVKESP
jgi:hypothetical protein